MTDQSLNPYAPPQVARQNEPVDEGAILQARFHVDERFQRRIAYDLIMPGAVLLTSSILVVLACMVIGAVYALSTQTMSIKGLSPRNVLVMGAAAGFFIGSPAAIVYHIVAHQWLQRRHLRRLREHPVLQATGEWVLEVDLAELRIHTAGGIARFPLADIWWHPPRGTFVLLQAPGSIPIGLPKKCDIEPSLPEEFARLLKKRVRRVPFT